ncbi:MAG: hypothetical protein WC683_02740 [bacterium]
MKFSVIYSFDIARGASVSEYRPPCIRQWQCTEGDESADYSEVFPHGKHRKYCAILTRKQFDKFVEQCGLDADTCETMGSLGAPGCGFGLAPAISFNGRPEDNWAIVNAYVTPIPEVERTWQGRSEASEEQAWYRIREAMLNTYNCDRYYKADLHRRALVNELRSERAAV